jgi:hypothetical protein
MGSVDGSLVYELHLDGSSEELICMWTSCVSWMIMMYIYKHIWNVSVWISMIAMALLSHVIVNRVMPYWLVSTIWMLNQTKHQPIKFVKCFAGHLATDQMEARQLAILPFFLQILWLQSKQTILARISVMHWLWPSNFLVGLDGINPNVPLVLGSTFSHFLP